MAQVGEIRISKRVVRVGHQTYPLANISRVQTLRLVWRGRWTTWYPIGEIIVLCALALGIAVAAQHLRFGQAGVVLTALIAVRVVFMLCVFLYRLVFRRRRYALMLETAGTQYTALSGTDLGEIRRIESVIVGAIENPPEREHVVQIHGDLVMGNKEGNRFVNFGRIGDIGGDLSVGNRG
jgi:hypothetical protein